MSTGTKTFLITGVSSGLGRAFAIAALGEGHQVIGTVRENAEVTRFEALDQGRAVGRTLNMSDEDAIARTVAGVQHDHGPVDVVIANAGYGHQGLFEESTMQDLRRQFEINVYGTIAVIKAVLPAMRERRRGHILAVTSVGGLTTSPGLSFYHGSKYALEGICESLGQEVAPFGIHVTAIAPGPFRTQWSGRSMTHSPRLIHDYDASFEPIRQARAHNNGHQPGDPDKAAAAVMQVIAAEDPPRHLLLGSAALRALSSGRAAFEQDITRWKALTLSTDFTGG